MTFLAFTETRDTGKTKVWSVDNSNDGSWLGQIKWHGAWRQYVFTPAARCIWSADCLAEVAAFIDARMNERKPHGKPLVVHEGPAEAPDDPRDPACVAVWPGCADGLYSPRCCRFPKSCSAGIITPARQAAIDRGDV